MASVTVPRVQGDQLRYDMSPGIPVFVLGANGTGKSTLLQRFYDAYHQQSTKITAYRQTSLDTNASTLSPNARRQYEVNTQGSDRSEVARYYDPHGQMRGHMALYDLIEAVNARARSIAAAYDEKNDAELKRRGSDRSPLTVIDTLLASANIPIQISITANAEVVANRAGHSTPYSIAALSDGERSALLLAAQVLTLEAGRIVIIDEPERHLHRAIISPLLSALLAERPDLYFLISTHEVMLPIDNRSSPTILLRSVSYANVRDPLWDAELVEAPETFDDATLAAILGSRKQVIFVEGASTSLDHPLYQLLFPQASVVPKANCRDVEHAVGGIRDSTDMHWVSAFGIVDDDRRSAEDVQRLRENGVFATPHYSVESLYYHPDIQQKMAERIAAVVGGDAAKNIDRARAEALKVLSADAERLAQRAAHQRIREDFMANIPGKSEIAGLATINVTVDIPAKVEKERVELAALIAGGDLAKLIARYPIRETAALAKIRESLGYKSKDDYRNGVIALLRTDDASVALLRNLFADLNSELGH